MTPGGTGDPVILAVASDGFFKSFGVSGDSECSLRVRKECWGPGANVGCSYVPSWRPPNSRLRQLRSRYGNGCTENLAEHADAKAGKVPQVQLQLHLQATLLPVVPGLAGAGSRLKVDAPAQRPAAHPA
jgi:hypothetical protein